MPIDLSQPKKTPVFVPYGTVRRFVNGKIQYVSPQKNKQLNTKTENYHQSIKKKTSSKIPNINSIKLPLGNKGYKPISYILKHHKSFLVQLSQKPIIPKEYSYAIQTLKSLNLL